MGSSHDTSAGAAGLVSPPSNVTSPHSGSGASGSMVVGGGTGRVYMYVHSGEGKLAKEEFDAYGSVSATMLMGVTFPDGLPMVVMGAGGAAARFASQIQDIRDSTGERLSGGVPVSFTNLATAANPAVAGAKLGYLEKGILSRFDIVKLFQPTSNVEVARFDEPVLCRKVCAWGP